MTSEWVPTWEKVTIGVLAVIGCIAVNFFLGSGLRPFCAGGVMGITIVAFSWRERVHDPHARDRS